MVTFRIIEVMKGTLHFTSKKGVGTEAIYYLYIDCIRYINAKGFFNGCFRIGEKLFLEFGIFPSFLNDLFFQ